MSAFEYLFTFFGLLLGLAAANVATGFADIWRDRRQTTVGICTPILALCMLLGAMNLWLRFWNSRDAMTLDAWHLIWVTCLALPYVFLSRGMFSGAGGATSLEAHYLAHRRVMLAALARPSPGVSGSDRAQPRRGPAQLEHNLDGPSGRDALAAHPVRLSDSAEDRLGGHCKPARSRPVSLGGVGVVFSAHSRHNLCCTARFSHDGAVMSR